MTRLVPRSETRRRALRLWLLAVAALMLVTLTVGGATRLTESGLSIVEWKPVTGVVPPLDASGWQAEFDKYKAIPQYRERHADMRLDEFKTIYGWGWTHRLLARLVGGVFLVPFLWFLWRGWVEPPIRARLWALEAAVLPHAFDVARTLRGGPALTAALALASAVTIQAALGIATLLYQAPLALALLHQGMAIVVLTIALVHAQRLARQPARIRETASDRPLRHGEQTT